MYGNSSFLMGDVLFNDNVINASNDGIEHSNLEDHGCYMHDNSTFVMGNIEFNLNQIESGNIGMDFDDFDYWGYNMYGNSSFLMGDVLFNDNVINATGGDGIDAHYFRSQGYPTCIMTHPLSWET
jgi:hypothetical protein